MRSKGMEEFRVAGVTSDKDKMLLRVELERPTVAAAVWDRAAKAHLSIISASFGDSHLTCYVERDAEDDWKTHLQQLSLEGFVRTYDLMPQIAPVSVVGDRFTQDGTALAEIMETLASSGISVTMGSVSALAATLAVPLSQADEAVRVLHERFVEGEKTE